MKKNFRDILKDKVLLLDGAKGTMLQRMGLKPGLCPEVLNIENPSIIRDLHRRYIEAGAEIIVTNTFGGNRIKLKEYNLENKIYDINYTGVRIAKEVAGDNIYVSASIGPTGRFGEPVGDMRFDEMVNIFREQAKICNEAQVDIFSIETMSDIKELKAAIFGIRDVTEKPIIAMMTFDENYRTLLGTPPESVAVIIEGIGVDVIGTNCGLGGKEILSILKRMSEVTSLPLIAQPNAGIPIIKDGSTIFPSTPEDLASYVCDFIKAGAKIIGGCCGTEPNYIKEIGLRIKDTIDRGIKKEEKDVTRSIRLSSRTKFFQFGLDLPPAIIGERINPTGKKEFIEELRLNKTSYVRKEAKGQKEKGAIILDVNVGTIGINEMEAMRKTIFAINGVVDLPIVIDSHSEVVLEEGLKSLDGKGIVNSVNGDKKRLDSLIPIAKRHGAGIIGLTLDEDGIPEDAEGRVRIAEKIIDKALSYGINIHDILIDPLSLAISANQNGAIEAIKAIRLIKERFGCGTVLGISNISFGLPNRSVINSAFLAMAIEAGLDAAIINPYDDVITGIFYASNFINNKDKIGKVYIERFGKNDSKLTSLEADKLIILETEIQDKLKYAIINGDKENIISLIEEELKKGRDPLDISNNSLIPGLEEVGRFFSNNIYFLPQVIQSAETMNIAFSHLKNEIKGEEIKKNVKILMATVYGDIHDIGKNIVSTLLEAHGFDIIDLGKSVPAEKIIDEAIKNNVDIVGLSALMTTTMEEMRNIVNKLRDRGIAVISIVGGAVVTEKFADDIGANIYAKDAIDALKKINNIIYEKRGFNRCKD